MKNKVDSLILQGKIIPYLLPEWTNNKHKINMGRDIRQWRREGLGLREQCEQHNRDSDNIDRDREKNK